MWIKKLEPTPLELELHWNDDRVISIPYLWLRDNCNCSECKIEQTSEKKFHVYSIDADIQPKDFGLNTTNNELSITWPDAHQTHYSAEYLHRQSEEKSPSLHYWGEGFVPPEFDFQQFLDDAFYAGSFIETFLETGTCILNNAPTQADTLELLIPRCGPIREIAFDRIHNVVVDSQGYNVASTNLELPPHNDLVSSNWPPSLQVLHMLQNDCQGGETIIVDSFAVAEQFRKEQPQFFEYLCQTPVPFRIFSDNEETYSLNPIITLDTNNRLKMVRYSNQTMQSIPLSLPNLTQFYQSYHSFAERINAEQSKASFRLKAGQMLMVNGHRVLHGRKAFVSTGVRHLQDAYYEHDYLRNHHYVLKRHGHLQ